MKNVWSTDCFMPLLKLVDATNDQQNRAEAAGLQFQPLPRNERFRQICGKMFSASIIILMPDGVFLRSHKLGISIQHLSFEMASEIFEIYNSDLLVPYIFDSHSVRQCTMYLTSCIEIKQQLTMASIVASWNDAVIMCHIEINTVSRATGKQNGKFKSFKITLYIVAVLALLHSLMSMHYAHVTLKQFEKITRHLLNEKGDCCQDFVENCKPLHHFTLRLLMKLPKIL